MKKISLPELKIRKKLLAEEKADLIDQFDEGDLTFRNFFEATDKFHEREIYLILEKENLMGPPRRSSLIDSKTIWLLVAVFTLGFFVSPFLYPKLFGYSSAEECALHTPHKWAVGVCFDLYPSIQK